MKKLFILIALQLYFSLFQGISGESMDWQQYIPQDNNGRISYGDTHFGKESFPSLTIYGNATLEGTTVNEKTAINGSVDANKATFNQITVNGNFQGTEIKIKDGFFNGSVSFKNTKVSGNLKINGSLISYYSDFKGKIFIDSTEIVFSNSKINDIIIENASTNFTKQTVHLKDKTVVKGSIIFKSGKGEVFVSGDSKLKENQIKGGKIYLEFKE
ncbi:MAG: hypothetical protein H7A23_23455 [Leptospiraceae bacterium]|nr:hypothetical protein [Leptospiraceae bacterium]MCP5497522.1 hypothetical protein [Leptospiraceae bacterium]